MFLVATPGRATQRRKTAIVENLAVQSTPYQRPESPAAARDGRTGGVHCFESSAMAARSPAWIRPCRRMVLRQSRPVAGHRSGAAAAAGPCSLDRVDQL